jgi:acetylornithine deacetylase
MSGREEALTALLRRLVAVDSTSSRPNAPMLDVLEPLLSAQGFVCRRQRYTDAGGVPKENLLAVPKRHVNVERLELVLVGHTDCVPFDASWTEALALTARDGRLYGRGACDTKAFIACAVVAAERTRASEREAPVGLIFTADEEVGCVGAKELVKEGRAQARYAIVGEPTGLTPIRAHKGYCIAEVEVSGKEGHSAYPDSGASAVFRASRLLTRLESFARGPLRALLNPAFEPPFTTLNVGVVQGGKAKNIIPGHCRFTLEWRPIPGQGVDHVAKELEKLIAQCVAEEPGFTARVHVTRLDGGVDTSEGSALVRFLSEASGRAPGTVSFGTEAPQLTALGAEAVVFGPGDIKVAHQTGEFVPVDELVRCEEILERAIAHLAPLQ